MKEGLLKNESIHHDADRVQQEHVCLHALNTCYLEPENTRNETLHNQVFILN